MRQLTQQGELTAASYKSLVQSGSGNTAAKWLTPICSNTDPTLSVSLSLSQAYIKRQSTMQIHSFTWRPGLFSFLSLCLPELDLFISPHWSVSSHRPILSRGRRLCEPNQTCKCNVNNTVVPGQCENDPESSLWSLLMLAQCSQSCLLFPHLASHWK